MNQKGDFEKTGFYALEKQWLAVKIEIISVSYLIKLIKVPALKKTSLS